MGLESIDRQNAQENFSLAQGILQESNQYRDLADDSHDADQELERELDLMQDPIIPPSFSGLSFGSGQKLLPSSYAQGLLASHEVQETVEGFNHVMRINFKDSDEFNAIKDVYVATINEFLAVNNVTGVDFKINTGIGTPIGGIKRPGEFVVKLTTEFVIDVDSSTSIDSITPTLKTFMGQADRSGAANSGDQLESRLRTGGYFDAGTKIYAGNTEIGPIAGGRTQSVAVAGAFNIAINNLSADETPTTNGTQSLSLENTRVGVYSIEGIDESLSTSTMHTYPIYAGGRRIGSISKFDAEPNAPKRPVVEMISAQRNPELFYENNGNWFPRIQEIQRFIQQKGGSIDFISSGPYLQDRYTMSGVVYDSGMKIGHEVPSDIPNARSRSNGFGFVGFGPNGEIVFTHSDDLSSSGSWQDMSPGDGRVVQGRVDAGYDISTLSIVGRASKEISTTNIPNSFLRNNCHLLVHFTDGSIGYVHLNGSDPQEKIAVFQGLLDQGVIDYIAANDIDAKDDYLDGTWYRASNNTMQYTHPENGDVFAGEAATSTGVIPGNFRALYIHYSVDN